MNDQCNASTEQAIQGPNFGGLAGLGQQGIALGGFINKQEKLMDLKTHKRLYDLAYSVKAFIDAAGGLTYQESCRFGQIMQEIINLK